MSNTIGSVKDLNASGTEALQALLRSLGGTTNDDQPSGAGLSTEQLQKLSEKIKEILGSDDEDRGIPPGDPLRQLLNEDGLPIIDISEPADEDFKTSTISSPTLDQDLIPASLLPPDERERRRRERERILDLLEEEERLQQLQEERDAEEERKEAIRKRKESAKAELEQLKAARELQKKMGRALVQHAKGAGENGQKEDAHSRSQPTPSGTKKKVSFADAPALEADERDQQTSTHQPGWSDVTPGRLRAQSRVSLVSTAEAQKYPMKMCVVERHTGTPTSSFYDNADSDDEPTSSAGHLSPHSENNSSGGEDRSSLSNNDLSDHELLEEGFDIDIAEHQREIALEYYEKRHAIGAETAKAMGAHALDDHDRQETLQSNSQSPLSRFRADRMAAAYNKSHGPVSTSIGPTVIPASRQKSLRNSVRLGILENDRLVGGESGESGSEDETIREVIQMLQTGNIQNVGPDFEPSSLPTITPRNSDDVEAPSIESPIAAHRAKPSRGGDDAETTTYQDNNMGDNFQSQPVISKVVERKAPRSLPCRRFPVNKPSSRSLVKISQPASPMIVDSPSFPMMPSFSAAHPTATGSPSTHQTHFERSPLVDSASSATRDPLSVKRPVSKFMAERKKATS